VGGVGVVEEGGDGGDELERRGGEDGGHGRQVLTAPACRSLCYDAARLCGEIQLWAENASAGMSTHLSVDGLRPESEEALQDVGSEAVLGEGGVSMRPSQSTMLSPTRRVKRTAR
jgi:hypothetical protein